MEYAELLQLCKDFWNSPQGREALRRSRDREHRKERVFKDGEMIAED